MLRGQAAPAHAPGVLQVPAVHVVEGVQVQVVAGHEAHRGDRREARAQQEHVAGRDLAREAPHEAALELVVVALGGPRSGVPRADQRDAVPQEDLGIRARCRPARDLPHRVGCVVRRHRAHLGTASSIASSSRFSSLPFG